MLLERDLRRQQRLAFVRKHPGVAADGTPTVPLDDALLDAFTQEPLPADHPYWGIPSVMITPHISGITVRELALEQIGSRIELLQESKPASGRVDHSQGY